MCDELENAVIGRLKGPSQCLRLSQNCQQRKSHKTKFGQINVSVPKDTFPSALYEREDHQWGTICTGLVVSKGIPAYDERCNSRMGGVLGSCLHSLRLCRPCADLLSFSRGPSTVLAYRHISHLHNFRGRGRYRR